MVITKLGREAERGLPECEECHHAAGPGRIFPQQSEAYTLAWREQTQGRPRAKVLPVGESLNSSPSGSTDGDLDLAQLYQTWAHAE